MVWRYLDCGVEEAGFARLRCDSCGREKLARLGYETIKELMIEAVGNDKARPGVVAVPQTFGNSINPHFHAHGLASRGVWDEKGQWIPVPYVDTVAAEKLFAHKIVHLLKTKGSVLQRQPSRTIQRRNLPLAEKACRSQK